MSKEVEVSKKQLEQALERMLLIRRFEEKAGQLYGMGKIGGFCHLYIGQEAVAIAIDDCLQEGDKVITSYRCHGQMLAAGSDPKSVLAELMGKEAGCSKGKGGSMHMFDIKRGFYGGHGIVGAQVPIGAGLAFASKYKDKKEVSIVYLGDGAVNQGQVYETFNMAALWSLPVIFVVENNQYAMGTSVARSCSTPDAIDKRGESFGIPGKKVNGMDYLECYSDMQDIISSVREGKGPMLVEVNTYRYRGHSMSDPAQYRSKEEVNKFKDEKDPINNLKSVMIKNKIMTEEDFKAIDKKIRDDLKDVVDFCENSPQPSIDELFTDIYNN